MKVWWCEEHDITGHGETHCLYAWFLTELGLSTSPCRMVEMQLVPADARIVGGESEHCDDCGQAYDEVYALPDALWARIHEGGHAGLLCPTCALNRVVGLPLPADARVVSGEADELLQRAWAVIANAGGEGGGIDWGPRSPGWVEAAIAWRERYHAYLDALSVSDPTKTEPPKDPWDYDP